MKLNSLLFWPFTSRDFSSSSIFYATAWVSLVPVVSLEKIQEMGAAWTRFEAVNINFETNYFYQKFYSFWGSVILQCLWGKQWRVYYIESISPDKAFYSTMEVSQSIYWNWQHLALRRQICSRLLAADQSKSCVFCRQFWQARRHSHIHEKRSVVRHTTLVDGSYSGECSRWERESDAVKKSFWLLHEEEWI